MKRARFYLFLVYLCVAASLGCQEFDEVYNKWWDQQHPDPVVKPSDPTPKPDPNDDIDIGIKPKPDDNPSIVPVRPSNALVQKLDQSTWVFDPGAQEWYFENLNSRAQTEPVFSLKDLRLRYLDASSQRDLALWPEGPLPQWRIVTKAQSATNISLTLLDELNPSAGEITLTFEPIFGRTALRVTVKPNPSHPFNALSLAWRDTAQEAIYVQGSKTASARYQKMRVHRDSFGPYAQGSMAFSGNIFVYNGYALSFNSRAPMFLDMGATQPGHIKVSLEASELEFSIFPPVSGSGNMARLAGLQNLSVTQLPWMQALWEMPEEYTTQEMAQIIQDLCAQDQCPSQILVRNTMDSSQGPLTPKPELVALQDALNTYHIALWLTSSPYVPLSSMHPEEAEQYFGGAKAKDLGIVVGGVAQALVDARSASLLAKYKKQAQGLFENWPQLRGLLIERSADLDLAYVERLNLSVHDYLYYRANHNNLLSPIYAALHEVLGAKVFLGAASAGPGDATYLNFVYFNSELRDATALQTMFQAMLHHSAGSYRASIAAVQTIDDPELLMAYLRLQSIAPIMFIPQQLLQNQDSYKNILTPVLKFRHSIQPLFDEAAMQCCAPVILPNSSSTDPVHPGLSIGYKLLAYPLLGSGAKTAKLKLPAGDWVRLPSGEVFSGPSDISVTTPEALPVIFGANYQILPMQLPNVDPKRTHYAVILGRPNGVAFYGPEANLSAQYGSNYTELRFKLSHSEAKFVYLDFYNTRPKVSCQGADLPEDETLAWSEAPDDALSSMRYLPNRVLVRLRVTDLDSCIFRY